MSSNKHKTNFLFGVAGTAVVFFIGIFSFVVGPKIFSVNFDNSTGAVSSALMDNVFGSSTDELSVENPAEVREKIKYVETPDAVKAIYMTACVAGTPSLRNNLIKLIDETEINSIVIDIKDFSGTISFETDNPTLVGVEGSGCRTNDMKELVKTFHENDVYVIGRITVFQDPFYTKLHPELAVQKASDGTVWKDYKGISFIDVSATEYWDYILELTKESHQMGFDEINFDYIRFPSDGNMKDIAFPFSDKINVADENLRKPIALENFFKYLKTEIDKYNTEITEKNPDIKPLITSADLFGMVTTSTNDLNIGQVLERALPYFDYIAPMVYPSHYPAHFNGWVDPNKYPYELIHFVMGSAVERIEKLKNDPATPAEISEHVSVEQLRTWIQDFDYGGNYDIDEVRAQIKASHDVGVDSWMIWSPSNRYTRGALEND